MLDWRKRCVVSSLVTHLLLSACSVFPLPKRLLNFNHILSWAVSESSGFEYNMINLSSYDNVSYS